MDHMRISGTEPSSVILSQTKLDFRVRKMTRVASQAGEAESSRTPGLISSVQTSMNDHVIRYYIVFVPH